MLAITTCLLVLVAVTVPSAARMREHGKTGLCAMNLADIGTVCKIYANENNESWPVPPFRFQAIDNGGIDYRNERGLVVGEPSDPGEVGFDRARESNSETPLDIDGGSTAVSVTRVLWLLVRGGDLRVEQFICPATRDRPDPSFVIDWYYDFASYGNMSYGYQVPFGPREARPREGADLKQVLAADKGPYYLNRFEPSFTDWRGNAIAFDDHPWRWRPYNSPNHRGLGQNCLYPDGAVFFEKTPAVGVDHDNIYTLMTGAWDPDGFHRIHGESPHFASVMYPYPGRNVFGLGAGMHAATDSLIYP